jgi:Mrp family chromosome partitioning ATPase
LRITGISATVLVAAMLILLSIMRHNRQEVERLLQGTDERPDTTAITARLKILRAQSATAESLVAAREARARNGANGPEFVARTKRVQSHADSIRRAESLLTVSLDSARRSDLDLDARVQQAGHLAAQSPSPVTLIAAALVVAIGVGFGVILAFELRIPRIADAAEAARVAGIPTLDTIGPESTNPQWMRRTADRELSPLIAAFSERYRHIYARVTAVGASKHLRAPIIAVVGDEADVVATLAANIAVASVLDSHDTLLIDADGERAAVTSILGVGRAPGVTDVLRGDTEWTAVIESAAVGRNRSLDVIPPGRRVRGTTPVQVLGITEAPPPPPPPSEGDKPRDPEPLPGPLPVIGQRVVDAGALRAGLIRLASRYELIVVAAPAGVTQVGPDSVLPMTDALLSARIAYTTLERLQASVSTLLASGLQIRGIVLWDADRPPRIPARE